MVLALISGIVGALSNALDILEMGFISKPVVIPEAIDRGFWEYYDNSVIGTASLRAASFDKYIEKFVHSCLKQASPEMQKYSDSIIEELNDVSGFEYKSEISDENSYMITVITYNHGEDAMEIKLYTFSPFLHETHVEAIARQSMRIVYSLSLNFKKDWMIVSKARSFHKTTMLKEIQYIPASTNNIQHIVESISYAMSPAVLGLVKLPDQYMAILDKILKQQMNKPDEGVITAPTAEQSAIAYEKFKEMRLRQEEYTKNYEDGFIAFGKNISRFASLRRR